MNIDISKKTTTTMDNYSPSRNVYAEWFDQLKSDTKQRLSEQNIDGYLDIIDLYIQFPDFSEKLKVFLNPVECKRIMNFCEIAKREK